MKPLWPPGTGTLPADIRNFIEEVRRKIGDESAKQFKAAFMALDLESDLNDHATGMFQAIGILVSRPRPFHERLEALAEVLNAKGKITVRIKMGAD